MWLRFSSGHRSKKRTHEVTRMNRHLNHDGSQKGNGEDETEAMIEEMPTNACSARNYGLAFFSSFPSNEPTVFQFQHTKHILP